MAMAQRRTDLAVEAHELWREGAGETTKLSGVRAEDGQREGFSTTVVTGAWTRRGRPPWVSR